MSFLLITCSYTQAGGFRVFSLKPVPHDLAVNGSKNEVTRDPVIKLSTFFAGPGSDSAKIKISEGRRIQNISTQKWLYLFGSIVTLGIGTYFYFSANRHYDNYKIATTDATHLHNIIVTEDIVWPIAYGLSAACFAMFIYKNIQQGKLEHRYHFSLAPVKNGAAVILTCDF
jgi:hypothetical protein